MKHNEITTYFFGFPRTDEDNMCTYIFLCKRTHQADTNSQFQANLNTSIIPQAPPLDPSYPKLLSSRALSFLRAAMINGFSIIFRFAPVRKVWVFFLPLRKR